MNTPLICTAPDHYSRGKHPRILALAVLPPAAFIAPKLVTTSLGAYEYRDISHFRIISRKGTAIEARVNGRTKTWKRTPRLEVPCKVGFRECFPLISLDGLNWLDEVPYRILSASDDQEPQS